VTGIAAEEAVGRHLSDLIPVLATPRTRISSTMIGLRIWI